VVAESDNVGVRVTWNVTVIVTGVVSAPAASVYTRTRAVNDPAGSVADTAFSVSVDGAVVALSVAVSHALGSPSAYSSAARRSLESVPVPPLVMVTFSAAGAAGAVMANPTVLRETAIAGCPSVEVGDVSPDLQANIAARISE